MKPVYFRNATFEDIKAQLSGRRMAVYAQLAEHGPCTTRELARRSGIDILAVRPRVTELVQLGFASCVPPVKPDAPGKEGWYQAEPEAFALGVFLSRESAASSGQLSLKLSQ